MNKGLKLILLMLIILASGLLITGCSGGSKPAPGPRVGKPAPDFQFQTSDGQSSSLSNLRGKPVLINFWATRCAPCVYEMPLLQEIHDEWSEKGLVLLAVNIGESSSQVNEFMQALGLTFPAALDSDGDIAQKYNLIGIPSSFFVDKDGVIQAMRIGAFRNKTEIVDSLSKITP